MKRRDTSGERSSEPHGLRAQLSRAVGESIDAIRSALSSTPKSVDVSKQRLSDVLWNDRAILKTHETAVAHAAHQSSESTTPTAAPDPAEALESLPDSEVVELAELAEDGALEAESDGADARAQTQDASGERVPRKRVDTRPSEIVRARLERAKARAAERMMPKGVAPISDSLEGERGDLTPLPENEPAALQSIELLSLEVQPVEAPPEPVESRSWLSSSGAAEQTKDAFLADLAPPEPAGPRAVGDAAPPPAAPAAPAPADEDEGGEEPIRTRSMARLLAMQGHRARALKIYDALLAANSGDESLRAEADALRHTG